jgi:hypothetical protein
LVAQRFWTFELPETFRLVKIPVDVMFGWAAVMSEPVKAVRFETPETFTDDKVPTEVMFGWDASTTWWANGTTPVTFEPLRPESPEPSPYTLEAYKLVTFEVPDTFKEVKVPTEVMNGWEGVITVPKMLVV